MTKCKGLIGKYFGHKYKSLITKYIIPPASEISGNVATIEAFADKEYDVICVRCGVKP